MTNDIQLGDRYYQEGSPLVEADIIEVSRMSSDGFSIMLRSTTYALGITRESWYHRDSILEFLQRGWFKACERDFL